MKALLDIVKATDTFDTLRAVPVPANPPGAPRHRTVIVLVRNVANGMTNTWGDIGSVAPSPHLRITGTANRGCSAIFQHCGLDDTDIPTVASWLQLGGSGPYRHYAIRDCYKAPLNQPIADATAIS